MLKKNRNIDKSFKINFENFYNQPNKENLHKIKKDYEFIRKKILENGDGYIIIKNFENSKKKFQKKIYLFERFSRLLGQNIKGEKIIKVQPRKKLLNKYKKKEKKKLRYHQTNLGGSIHSDGPQLYRPPRYIIMGCLEQTKVGGESIITDTQKIFKELSVKKINILKTLRSKFYFERRGFGKNKTLLKPIFEKKRAKTEFRYLRDYIESAYKIKKIKLNKKKIEALNYLDNLLSFEKYQKIYKLGPGDIIILNNKIFAHGRKAFRVTKKNNRSLLRAWIK